MMIQPSKYGAKEIAQLNGRAVTFMAKYDIERVGSSGHIHSSWVDEAGRNDRWLAGGPEGSREARQRDDH